jgi:short-subunit dehydrogenase
MAANKQAIIIGNSDGIGLALTRRLLDTGWTVQGFSRSPGPIDHQSYRHEIIDVTDSEYLKALTNAVINSPDLCVYCAGIGELLDFNALERERQVFNVNLIGFLKTSEIILPAMIKQGRGHLIVLSSLGDRILSPEAPSYHASKAGLSSYVESLALAVRDRGVAVTNLRFGFVDTKMAKGDRKIFMMTVDQAVDHIFHCIKTRPIRYSRPRIMEIMVSLHRAITRLKM